MKASIKKGLSYGMTSGVITSLGLLVGLYSASSTVGVILAGLLTIAFADAFSDGLGIHISEESSGHLSNSEVWEATIATVASKMALGLSFIIPILLLPLNVAVVVDFIWGFLALMFLSYVVAKQNKDKITSVLFEHTGLAIFVVLGSFLIGEVIKNFIK